MIANFLLLLLVLISLFSFFLPLPDSYGGRVCLKIFQGGSLGGLGGALADWYAVTALFKRPLGLRLPHTDIIARNKDKIADNIAKFVVNEFLNETEILSLIAGLGLGKKIRQKIFDFFFSKQDKISFFQNKEKERALFRTYLFENVLFSAENAFLLTRLLQFNVRKNRDKIVAYVEQRVKEQGGSLLGWAVGSSIGRKVVSALEQELEKINFQDPSFLNLFLQKRDALRHSLQREGKNAQATDFKNPASVFRKRLLQLETQLSECCDMIQAEKIIDDYLADVMTRNLPVLRDKAFFFLQSVMGKWNGRDIAGRLEKAVGKDLAYIRVNGALVGFFIASLIEGSVILFNFVRGSGGW